MPPENNQPGDGGNNSNTENQNGNAGGLTAESITSLMQGIATLSEGITKLNTLAESGRARQTENNAPVEEEEEEEEDSGNNLSEIDLETMPRAKFAEFISDRILNAIEKKLAKPLASQVQNVQNSVEAQRLQREIEGLQSKNKDYWDWKDEMVEIAKATPGLSPARVYALAKSENPEKAAELSKKYSPGDDENKRPKGKTSFGGFQPGTTSASSKNTKMTTDQALSAAYEEVVAKYGDGIFSES